MHFIILAAKDKNVNKHCLFKEHSMWSKRVSCRGEPWLMVDAHYERPWMGLRSESLEGRIEKHLVTHVSCWLWSSRFWWPGHRPVPVRHQHMQVRWGVSKNWEHGDVHLWLQGKSNDNFLVYCFSALFYLVLIDCSTNPSLISDCLDIALQLLHCVMWSEVLARFGFPYVMKRCLWSCCKNGNRFEEWRVISPLKAILKPRIGELKCKEWIKKTRIFSALVKMLSLALQTSLSVLKC